MNDLAKFQRLLETIDAGLAEVTEALEGGNVADALSNLAAAIKEAKGGAATSINVSPTPVEVRVQAPTWSKLRVSLVRDPISGEVKDYLFQRIA